MKATISILIATCISLCCSAFFFIDSGEGATVHRHSLESEGIVLNDTSETLIVFEDRAGMEYYTKARISAVYSDRIIAFDDDLNCPIGEFTITATSAEQKYCGRKLFLYFRP